MSRIHGMFSMTVSNDQRSQYNDLQSLLCATLQAVVRKIKPQDIAQIADKCMEALLKMMEYVFIHKLTRPITNRGLIRRFGILIFEYDIHRYEIILVHHPELDQFKRMLCKRLAL